MKLVVHSGGFILAVTLGVLTALGGRDGSPTLQAAQLEPPGLTVLSLRTWNGPVETDYAEVLVRNDGYLPSERGRLFCAVRDATA